MHALPCRLTRPRRTPSVDTPLARRRASDIVCRQQLARALALLAAGPLLLACSLGCGSVQAQTMASAGTAPLAGRSANAAGRLQLELAHGAHVFYEPKPWQAADPAPSAAGGPPPRASLGLGFRTAPSGAAGMRGLLKVQLSSDSALHFRPRGGGMTVTYRSQF